MREDDFPHLLERHLGFNGHAAAVQDFRTRVSKHVHAQHLMIFLASYDLAYSLAPLILSLALR